MQYLSCGYRGEDMIGDDGFGTTEHALKEALAKIDELKAELASVKHAQDETVERLKLYLADRDMVMKQRDALEQELRLLKITTRETHKLAPSFLCRKFGIKFCNFCDETACAYNTTPGVIELKENITKLKSKMQAMKSNEDETCPDCGGEMKRRQHDIR